jgi:hypothetical protein
MTWRNVFSGASDLVGYGREFFAPNGAPIDRVSVGVRATFMGAGRSQLGSRTVFGNCMAATMLWLRNMLTHGERDSEPDRAAATFLQAKAQNISHSQWGTIPVPAGMSHEDYDYMYQREIVLPSLLRDTGLRMEGVFPVNAEGSGRGLGDIARASAIVGRPVGYFVNMRTHTIGLVIQKYSDGSADYYIYDPVDGAWVTSYPDEFYAAERGIVQRYRVYPNYRHVWNICRVAV